MTGVDEEVSTEDVAGALDYSERPTADDWQSLLQRLEEGRLKWLTYVVQPLGGELVASGQAHLQLEWLVPEFAVDAAVATLSAAAG